MNSFPRQAMTLIELLIVTFILAAMATSVVVVTDNIDQAQRQQVTLDRLQAMKTAILGPEQTGGMPVAAGYIQDLGWLPSEASHLSADGQVPLTAGLGNLPVPKRQWVEKWHCWAGWGGPYLSPLPARQTGGLLSYDGWGTDWQGWATGRPWEDPNNLIYRTLDVKSSGPNGAVAGGDDLPANTLVALHEWTVDLNGWLVEVRNFTSAAIPLKTVYLKVTVPRWNKVVDDGNPTPALDYPAEALDDELSWTGISQTSNIQAIPAATGPDQPGVCRFVYATSERKVAIGARTLWLVNKSNGLQYNSTAYAYLMLHPRLKGKYQTGSPPENPNVFLDVRDP